MPRTGLRALLGLSALLALAAPAGVSASAGFPLPLPAGTPPQVRALVEARIGTGKVEPPRRSIRQQFVLHGSHRYTVTVFAQGGSVIVEVGRRHGHAISAYVAKGVVKPGRIQADFGALGSVSMRFQPSRARGAVTRKHFCHGVPLTVERHGTYAGRVRLEGEGGYVTVDARRAKGKLTSTGPLCRRHAGHRAARLASSSSHRKRVKRPRLFFAGWRDAVDSQLFGALTLRDDTRFFVFVEHSEGRLATFRFASTVAPPRAFALDDAITRAKLSPPKPFSGAGIYRAAPDGTTTWEGSLAVDFPGAPGVSLTGPRFEVELGAGF